MWLAQHGLQNPNDAGAGAVDYLRLMGIVMVGWMWARMAKLSLGKDDAVAQGQADVRPLLDGADDPGMPHAAGAHPGGQRAIMAFDGMLQLRLSGFRQTFANCE